VAALPSDREWISIGDKTMVTKQDDAFIVKNLIALAAVETIGAAIALGFVFNLL